MSESRRARVASGHRDMYTVVGCGEPRLVGVAGRLRHEGMLPAVGDWVELDPSLSVIRSVEPRVGVLERASPDTGEAQVLAANVDVAFVVTSPNRDLNARRLERFVALADAGGVPVVALLNKIDLTSDVEPALGEVRLAVGGGVPVLPVSARTGAGLEALGSWLPPKATAVLLGTSGVGKSTLTNALLGAEVQATAPIRAVDDRGRHTTVIRSLLELPSGAYLIDTPGLKLPRMTATATAASFDELDALEGQCRFADCTHVSEPGCAVLAALESGELSPARWDAAQRLEREARWAAERDDQRARKARGRAGSRLLREELRRKGERD